MHIEFFDMTEHDVEYLESHGLTRAEIFLQLQILQSEKCKTRLERACTPGDGIRIIGSTEADRYLNDWEEAVAHNRLMRFVPASGAATRMFSFLNSTLLRYKKDNVNREKLENRARTGDREASETLHFLQNIEEFALYKRLEDHCNSKGISISKLQNNRELTPLLEVLLTDKGLNLAGLPKGLIPFHSYKLNTRTAFEEQLIESVSYARNQNNRCVIHFTISIDHEQRIRKFLMNKKRELEREFDVLFDLSFSIQQSGTDTIALSKNKKLMRTPEGLPLLRPGGHGALLTNLNQLDADIVFIKNIDNVLVDRYKPEMVKWKQTLCGMLVALQRKSHEYVWALSENKIPSKRLLEEASDFIQEFLGISVKNTVQENLMRRKSELLAILNRPLRVCGVVRNVGAPGGGPFWVRDHKGFMSCQIVENAQIDLDDVEQRNLFEQSTHFNPVDIVCGMSDAWGEKYNLFDFRDPKAYFLTHKVQHGETITVLEHPGLWNGSMAYWNTIFVEVPEITFNPVKKVLDLLHPSHMERS